MKVKTLIRFKDLEKDTIREVGEVFEVTKKRATELSTEKNRAGKSRKIEGSGDRESRVRQSRFLIFLYVSNRQKVC